MPQGLRALMLGTMLTAAHVACAQQSASPQEATKIVLPAGFTTQESTIGQKITLGDPRQYAGATIKKSPGVRVLADSRGLSVYTFDGDKTPGKSACIDRCVLDWLPLAAPLMAAPPGNQSGDWSVMRRADGSPQWVYKGKPLYTFVRDAKAGDTKGDGAGGLWHVALP